MSEELRSYRVGSEDSIVLKLTRLRSSLQFRILMAIGALLALSTLLSCLIVLVVLRDRDPQKKDVQRYREVRAFYDELVAMRDSPTPDFSDIREKFEKARQEMVSELKNEASPEHPAKQQLLFALRDELPRMMLGDLMESSPAELHFVANLDRAAQELGLK